MEKFDGIYWPGQLARGLFTGALTGLAISLYSNMIALATATNRRWPALVLLIPLGAVLTQLVFKLFGERYRSSTVSAIDDINNHKSAKKNWAESQIPASLSPMLGLVAFIGAGITHLVGASGGKEGAGVQIGLACSAIVEKGEAKFYSILHKEHDNRSDYYLMCGAAAAFGALFRAPVAGVLFGTLLASPKATRMDAWLPCIASSFTAVWTSQALGCHILEIPAFTPLDVNVTNIGLVLFLAILTGLYARLFCFALHTIRAFFQRHIKNPYAVVGVPALILLLLSIATLPFFGSFRYNGLGGDLLYDIISGEATQIDDVIKLLLVAFTFASGFVGGEVVPLMIVGAGFGMSISTLLDAPLAPFAVLGSIGMLSGGTNLPLVCFALGLELYGYSEPTLLFLMCAATWLSSGKSGIYSHQKLPYR